MVHVVARDPRGLGLYEELCCAIYAEVVIRAQGSFRRYFDDHIAIMGRFVVLVLDVPAESSEEGVQEVDADLGFGIAFGEVVVFILFELRDQGLYVFPE